MNQTDRIVASGLEQLSEGFGIFDDDLKLVSCNTLFRKLRNYSEDLCLPGTSLESMIRFNAERGDFGPGLVDEHVSERMTEIRKSDQREIIREMHDGRILKIRYQHLNGGGLTITFEDKTDEQNAKKALEDSEERYSLVARATSDGLYDWNISTNELYVSERLNELFAFDDANITSQQWAERIHKEDLSNYVAAIRSYFKGITDHLECEYRITGKSGDYHWVRDYAVGVNSDEGRVVRLVGAVRDVTEVKAAENERDQAETRLLDSLETIDDGFLLLDAEGRVQLWNRRYMEIFEEAAGQSISDIVVKGTLFLDMIKAGYQRDIFKPHPGGLEGWIEARGDAKSKLTAQLEMELNNGRWLLINERTMSDGGRVAVYADITDFKTREAELEAERTRFEDAIESLSTGFVLFDADDILVVCNTKYKEYFAELDDVAKPGAIFTDIVRTAIDRGLFPEAIENPETWLASLLETRAATTGAREQYLQNGSWLQISDQPTKDGGIVSIYTDISDLKNQEVQLLEQSAILEATLENMDQAISMVDDNLDVVVFNNKFLDYMDFPASEFKRGFNMSQAFRFNAKRGEYGNGDVEEQVREKLELATKFQPHRFERQKLDGTVLEIVGNPVASGGFVTTYTNITARKQAEEELRRSQSELNAALGEFSAVLDTIDYGVLFTGSDFKARIINRSFANLWGISQEFVDTSPNITELMEYNRDRNLYDVDAENWDDWLQDCKTAIEAGDIAPTELWRRDGKFLQYQCIALADGGRMLTYFDITPLKEREAEITMAKNTAEQALEDLRVTQDRLVHAEKMASLGQLTAGIAHEIKNPLNFVNNFSKLSAEMLDELAELLETPIAALEKDDREDAKDLLATVRGNLLKIDEHGKRADSIVKNMLSHSREGSGEKQSVDLGALAAEALNLAYHGARAADSSFNVEMKTEMVPDLALVECHPQDLQRVFLNLCSNGMYEAMKRYKTGGEPPVMTVASKMEDGSVVIEVSDNGGGVPVDIRDKIFQPFFTTKPTGEGTGLGLSMSYDIVKQYGGLLSLDSETGKGTTFRVSMPAGVSAGAVH